MPGVRPVLIAGPTAGGKSGLALRIAERDGGRVINADALQVYACWRVLTARPSPEDIERAPHALYGHVSCDARYSVGHWLRDVRREIETARRRGERPVIVGGTGLYFSALTRGLSDIPEVPAEVRARADEMLRSDGLAAMLASLALLDPVTHGRIDTANPARVQRAWEVVTATGRGLAAWHATAGEPVLRIDECLSILIEVNKAILNRRIEQRFSKMIEHGALEECRSNLVAERDVSLPSMRAIGAAELGAHLRGEMSLDAAIEAACVATRQYAKRQRTWFRNRMAEWTRIDPDDGDPLAAIPVN